jgi:hypothetical protein
MKFADDDRQGMSLIGSRLVILTVGYCIHYDEASVYRHFSAIVLP